MACYWLHYSTYSKMKYCGCNRCKLNGEVSPQEQFEIYLAQKEDEKKKEFESTLGRIFSVAELDSMEKKFHPPDYTNANIAARLGWYGYGGLGGFI